MQYNNLTLSKLPAYSVSHPYHLVILNEQMSPSRAPDFSLSLSLMQRTLMLDSMDEEGCVFLFSKAQRHNIQLTNTLDGL